MKWIEGNLCKYYRLFHYNLIFQKFSKNLVDIKICYVRYYIIWVACELWESIFQFLVSISIYVYRFFLIWKLPQRINRYVIKLLNHLFKLGLRNEIVYWSLVTGINAAKITHFEIQWSVVPFQSNKIIRILYFPNK